MPETGDRRLERRPGEFRVLLTHTKCDQNDDAFQDAGMISTAPTESVVISLPPLILKDAQLKFNDKMKLSKILLRFTIDIDGEPIQWLPFFGGAKNSKSRQTDPVFSDSNDSLRKRSLIFEISDFLSNSFD